MSKQETDMNLFIVIALVLMAILSSVFLKIKNWFLQTFNEISTAFNSIVSFAGSHVFYFIVIIVDGIFVIYIICRIIKTIKNKIKSRNEKVSNLKDEAEEIEKILKTSVRHDAQNIEKSSNLINEKIKLCENSKELIEYIKPLKKKLKAIGFFNEELEHEQKINDLEIKEREIDSRIEEKERKIREAEQNKQILLRRLEIWKNRVFKKSELRDKEIEALKEEGFEQVNQFDILEKRFISFLIKPYEKLNHSREHIFLVWSVKRFLEQKGIEIIEEHLTKGADITFKHNKKWFAIEIETGSMLEKSKKLKEKVDYLNKQYPNRWFFIVSNEKLVPRYAKFGLSTSRNRVPEMLEKLLKNA